MVLLLCAFSFSKIKTKFEWAYQRFDKLGLEMLSNSFHLAMVTLAGVHNVTVPGNMSQLVQISAVED